MDANQIQQQLLANLNSTGKTGALGCMGWFANFQDTPGLFSDVQGLFTNQPSMWSSRKGQQTLAEKFFASIHEGFQKAKEGIQISGGDDFTGAPSPGPAMAASNFSGHSDIDIG